MAKIQEKAPDVCRHAAAAIAVWRQQGDVLTREALAARVGTSVSTVVRWEHPQLANPRFSEILAMEQAKPGIVKMLFDLSNLAYSVPVKTVSEANQRDHWAKKASRTKSLRQAGHLHTMAAVAKHFGRTASPDRVLADHDSVEILLTRVAPGQLDDDNLASSLKAFRDGVADAFQSDDKNPKISWKYAQVRGKTYSVEVTLTWHRKNPSLPQAE